MMTSQKKDVKKKEQEKKEFFVQKVYKLSDHIGISIQLQNSICFLINRMLFIVYGKCFPLPYRNKKRFPRSLYRFSSTLGSNNTSLCFNQWLYAHILREILCHHT
uniref:Uncharacterized protein n=1 Tax=Pseudopediastrum sp. CL0201VA TaxID=2184484 RepID=A0A2U8GJR7_9CHLO|nr:hypothetical protein [Pseudopediastrum sp. CL0201VA]AWI68922.1 hypothetical protein [Pseudopediastrum sp. CL0201VA]